MTKHRSRITQQRRADRKAKLRTLRKRLGPLHAKQATSTLRNSLAEQKKEKD